MDGVRQVDAAGASQNPTTNQPAHPAHAATRPGQDSATPAGFSLVDAYALLGSRRTLVTDIVLGSDNQIAQIRVVDSATHEVVGTSPPDTIARILQEMQAYRDAARSKQATG